MRLLMKLLRACTGFVGGLVAKASETAELFSERPSGAWVAEGAAF